MAVHTPTRPTCTPFDLSSVGSQTGLHKADRDKFPERLFLIAYPDGKYASYCFKKDDLHGIACFSTEQRALAFAQRVRKKDPRAEEMSLQDAVEALRKRREVAPELRCLFLIDGSFFSPTATYWVDL